MDTEENGVIVEPTQLDFLNGQVAKPAKVRPAKAKTVKAKSKAKTVKAKTVKAKSKAKTVKAKTVKAKSKAKTVKAKTVKAKAKTVKAKAKTTKPAKTTTTKVAKVESANGKSKITRPRLDRDGKISVLHRPEFRAGTARQIGATSVVKCNGKTVRYFLENDGKMNDLTFFVRNGYAEVIPSNKTINGKAKPVTGKITRPRLNRDGEIKVLNHPEFRIGTARQIGATSVIKCDGETVRYFLENGGKMNDLTFFVRSGYAKVV